MCSKIVWLVKSLTFVWKWILRRYCFMRAWELLHVPQNSTTSLFVADFARSLPVETSATESSQPQAIQLQNPLKMRE